MKEELKTFGSFIKDGVKKLIVDLFFMMLMLGMLLVGVVFLFVMANTVCGTAANDAFICVLTVDGNIPMPWVK